MNFHDWLLERYPREHRQNRRNGAVSEAFVQFLIESKLDVTKVEREPEGVLGLRPDQKPDLRIESHGRYALVEVMYAGRDTDYQKNLRDKINKYDPAFGEYYIWVVAEQQDIDEIINSVAAIGVHVLLSVDLKSGKTDSQIEAVSSELSQSKASNVLGCEYPGNVEISNGMTVDIEIKFPTNPGTDWLIDELRKAERR